MREHMGPSQRGVERGVALGMVAFALVVIVGSLRAGIGWGTEGPRSGFFPFYVGVMILIASIANLARATLLAQDRVFASWDQLRQVVSVVIPTAIYVAAVPWLGLYLSSVMLITGFMIWLGRYRPPLALGLAAAVMALTYVTFERWFLVPLPKGPVEDLLGL